MSLSNLKKPLSTWTKTQWQSVGLLSIISIFVISLVPVLQSNASTHKPPALVRYISTAYQRKAVNFKEYHWRSVTVEPGQTLGDIFNSLNVSHKVMHRVLATETAKQAFKSIRDGDIIDFEINGYNQLRAMRFDKNDVEIVELTIQNQEIQETITGRKLEHRLMVSSGEITHSLYADAQRAGLSGRIVHQIADVFKYDIDFSEDLRAGDNFQVVYEQSYLDGEPYKQGRIQAAIFTNRGKKFSAYRYNYNGSEQYFDETGRPLKKVLLRIPIEFARLSSTFGMRKHPVLGRMRAHKGVDYAARPGTPIMAAGDGRVEYAGWKNGYGKTVIINHGQGRSTLYGHMSSINIKKGQSISQGSIIGRVGSTGLATGPHLHYEFRVGGTQVNPLNVTMPKPEPLHGAELTKFKNATAPSIAMMEQSATTQLQ